MQLEVDITVSNENCPAEPSLQQGLLFVLSAPSGAGKDTVIHELKQHGMDFHVIASLTTRSPRPGESEGHPYHFITEERFKQFIAENELLEYAYVHGNWYGQPRQPIRDHLQAGRDVLLKIDVQGAETVRRKVPQAIFIFLVPSSIEELALRLEVRQTETKAERQKRLIEARTELAQQHHSDYTIINRQGYLQEAVNQLQAIMIAEHARTHPHYIEM